MPLRRANSEEKTLLPYTLFDWICNACVHCPQCGTKDANQMLRCSGCSEHVHAGKVRTRWAIELIHVQPALQLGFPSTPSSHQRATGYTE